MAFILTHLELFAGAFGIIMIVGVLLVMRNGIREDAKEETENKISAANKEANEKSLQTAEAIINAPLGSGISKWRSKLRPKD